MRMEELTFIRSYDHLVAGGVRTPNQEANSNPQVTSWISKKGSLGIRVARYFEEAFIVAPKVNYFLAEIKY